MSISILAYNYTYNELSVQSDKKHYTYGGVSPYLYDKITALIRKGYQGKVWQILHRLELVTEI